MSSTTDKDALVVSQIAYMNIENGDIEEAVDRYGSATLENIFEVTDGKIEQDYIERVYGNKDPKTTKLSEYEQMRLEEAKAFIEEIKNSEYAQWEIVEIKDDNANSGFYGCMIDCGDGQSMFGFRGSESDSIHQKRQDWFNADFALFNNILTEQQKVAQDFVKDMNKKYGDKYTVFDFSGHSLGGNLSQHAGITVPASMQDKVGTIYNLDGPGYSDEYLLSHALEIDNMSSHVKHYQWSVIGNLLNQMPGEMFQSIRT
ncbi:MAG: Mbeg1-like protein, partial [Coprococcus phoceensis]